MASPDSYCALSKIAETLGMPISAFLDPPTAGTSDPSIDAAELLTLFNRISDEQKRRECIEFVRALAD